MKKYLLGTLAIMIAVASVAFTTNHNKVLNTQFKYIGPSSPVDYTTAANWDISSVDCQSLGTIKCLVTPNNANITSTSDLVSEISSNGFSNIVTNSTKQ